MAEENPLFFSSKKPSVILRRDVTSSRSSPKAISAITSSQHKEYHEEAKPTRNQRMQRRGTSSYQKLEQNQDCMIVSSLPISLIKRAAQKEERESTHQPISAISSEIIIDECKSSDSIPNLTSNKNFYNKNN